MQRAEFVIHEMTQSRNADEEAPIRLWITIISIHEWVSFKY